jgi:hypothetical protein
MRSMVANLDRSAIQPYKRARMPLPADNAIATPQEALRAKLVTLVDQTMDRMLETGNIEPGLLSLIVGANAAIAVLDARQRPEEPA